VIPCKTFRPVTPPRSLGRVLHTLGTILLTTIAAQASADHVLVAPGRGVFNISVESTLTTPTSAATVRTDPALSFGFDIRTGIYPISGMTINTPVLDYVLTTATIGKKEARQLLLNGPWAGTRRQRPQVLALFTPAPPPTPTPLPTPEPTPDPRRLADPTLPLFTRIDRQLTLFTQEQKNYLAEVAPQRLSTTETLRLRIALLDNQIELFRSSYPPNDMATSQGIEALLRVRENLLQNGRFAHEND
jgi:hypothetical protein